MTKLSDQTPPFRKRKKQQDSDLRDGRTESAILQAARVVFTRRGTSGARIQEIAAEAGVNQALIHYYFRSKAALAERVFVEAAGKVLGELLPVVVSATDLETLIERFVTTYIAAIRRTPFLPSYLLSEVAHHPERLDALVNKAAGVLPGEVAARALQRLNTLIAESVAAGRARPVPPRQLLINVLSLVVFPFAAAPIVRQLLQLDDAGFEEFLDERARKLPGFILNAIRP